MGDTRSTVLQDASAALMTRSAGGAASRGSISTPLRRYKTRMVPSLKTDKSAGLELTVNESQGAHLPSLEESIPMLLIRAREAVMLRFRPHLHDYNLTEQQWRILRVLAQEKAADMLSLSVKCCIQPPSLSRTVPLLVERGLVRRCNHGNDQRRIMVDLTPQGRTLFKCVSAESARIHRRLQKDIGGPATADVYRGLHALIALQGTEAD